MSDEDLTELILQEEDAPAIELVNFFLQRTKVSRRKINDGV